MPRIASRKACPRFFLVRALLWIALLNGFALSAGISPSFSVKSLSPESQTAVIVESDAGTERKILRHQKAGAWTLMAVLEGKEGGLAVFENLDDQRGGIAFMSAKGLFLFLPKSLEPTTAPAETLYRGRTMEEIVQNPKDVLAAEILAEKGDPTFEKTSGCLPPLRIPTFVGTNHSVEKVVFEYGGASINYIDAGKLFPEIAEARKKLDVREGLVGGWLHIPRYLFPSGGNRHWEEVLFADPDPFKFWTQPVWYRILLVDGGQVKDVHYFYHHIPYPPRGEPEAPAFYQALLRVHAEMQESLNPRMKIEVPEKNISDFCLHSLGLEILTRTGAHPRYGYPPIHQQSMFKGFIGSGFSNVDSFQDTFNSSVTTFLEWGLFDEARRFIDNYFTEFVRDDGSIDTRGPEIGQYGRMLTALAQYLDYTKDDALILRFRAKILAIVNLLSGLREESLKLPSEDPAYGIISGWSEHDSGLQSNPYRFVLPHFSNSAEVARGFQDLGRALAGVGRKISDGDLERTGNEMAGDSREMRNDLNAAIERSIDRNRTPPYVPAVAGDKPTLWKNRVYAEMLASGVLAGDIVQKIAACQSESGERLLGLMRNGKALNGFVVYGYAYGLLQHDMIREFLLFYYSHMAHLHSRGTWTAVEVASVDGTPLSTFCTPAQLTIPALTKWMLVFEDPGESVLWLAKAAPRTWLENGRKISVEEAPTRFGKIGYELRSEVAQGKVRATIVFPPAGIDATTNLRIRVPDNRRIRKVIMNGKPWKGFNPSGEVIVLPPGLKGRIDLEVIY